MTPPPIHIFGVRHHGPGSARSLQHALAALQPDLVLVEGPPDADSLLPLLAHPQLVPPVALLVYAADTPRRAVFYPLARFSPELVAFRYAAEHAIPVRCMDLPQWHQLALEPDIDHADSADASPESQPSALSPQPSQQPSALSPQPSQQPSALSPQPSQQPSALSPQPSQQPSALSPQPSALPTALSPQPSRDPLGALAAAAGYSDGERWWEHLVEQRRDGLDLFAAILEAMTALREADPTPLSRRETLREAWMRKTIRSAVREGFRRIAVVCGAWHGPALVNLGPAKLDDQALKGLPKLKTAANLAPWSYGRLTFASGYGAGIAAPGWYDHLWALSAAEHSPTDVAVRWMARVAHLLREAGIDASAAHVIEAVRLAEALAALRERPLPGLPELDEAARAVFSFGDPAPMALIHERLTINDRLGALPDDTPSVPLQQDLRREQRRLRLAPEVTWRDLDLDLRKPTDRERSALLRRLNLLGIGWGEIGESSGKGTFREIWRIQWEPAFDVALIEASLWGTTVQAAAAAHTLSAAQHADSLRDLVALVNQALFADLPETIAPLMELLQARAAQHGDAGDLIDALTAEDPQTRSSLSASVRYGSVRDIDTTLIGQVIDGIVARICVGLPFACAGLADEPAEAMFHRILAADAAIAAMQRPGGREAWLAAITRVADAPNIHGLIAGRCCRILLDTTTFSGSEAARRLSLALAPANPPAAAAAWIEGFLHGSGLLLVHDDTLWQVIDAWVSGLAGDTFQTVLPLLRRTFAAFAVGERRMLGERAARTRGPINVTPDDAFDHARGAAALAIVAQIWGGGFAPGYTASKPTNSSTNHDKL